MTGQQCSILRRLLLLRKPAGVFAVPRSRTRRYDDDDDDARILRVSQKSDAKSWVLLVSFVANPSNGLLPQAFKRE